MDGVADKTLRGSEPQQMRMDEIRTLRDLDVYKLAREQTRRIFKLSKAFSAEEQYLTGEIWMGVLAYLPCAKPSPRLAQIQILHAAPELSLSRHRLNVAVPLQRERGQAKLDCGSDFVLSRSIRCQLADRIDLTTAVAFILFGVKLVSFGGTG